MTESESIGRWNKKTRYSLTKGSSVSRPGGTQAAFPNHRQEGEGEGDPSTAEPLTVLNLPVNMVLHGPAHMIKLETHRNNGIGMWVLT